MILTLYITFLILAFSLLLIGYIFHNSSVSDILIVVGWTFIFALGVILSLNSVQYKIGTTSTTSYTYIEYDYIVDGTNFTDIVIDSSITTIKNDYNYFSTEGTGVLARVANSHLWGFLLMIVGLMGAILFWFDVRAYGQTMEEANEENN